MADGPYSIDFSPSARRQLAKLSGMVQRRVSRTIDRLAFDPRPAAAKRLAGQGSIWRLRVGNYRILYRIADNRLVVLVIRVGHRRDVYR